MCRQRLLLLLAACVGALSALSAPGSVASTTATGSRPMVVGGHNATDSFPFMVALVFPPNGQGVFQRQFCGGALIAPTWVLTAAHCVTNEQTGRVKPATAMDVVIGEANLEAGTGQEITLIRIIRHPQFGGLRNLRNDAALLELSAPAAQAPVPLVGPGQDQLWAAGARATIIGWGDLGAFAPGHQPPGRYPRNLQEASLPLVSDVACANSGDGGGFDPRSMLCAGNLRRGGIDTCDGDSGGPLLVGDGAGGWLEAGIVSWGYGCAQPQLPGVYGKVATLRCFVRTHVSPGLPDSPDITSAHQSRASLDLTWRACDGGSSITGYTITIQPGGIVINEPGSATHADINGLPLATPFTITMTATNANGTSAPLATGGTPSLGAVLRNIHRPLLTGRLVVGKTVGCTHGGWVGAGPITYATAFVVRGRLVTKRRLKLTPAMAGRTVACVAAAHSATGDMQSAASKRVRIRAR